MTKKNQYLMVFDVGTGAIRCSIIDQKGECISSTYKEHSYNVPKGFPGGLEFNPSIFWKTICSLSKLAMKKGGIKSEKIIAVTSTSQREGIVLLDKSGKELYSVPNIDFRATEEEREIAQFFGEKIYRISGRWPSSMFTPCRLEWFRKHKPKTFDKISHLLMINDWVLYKLSGELYSEPTNACETALFDISNLTWSQELLKSLKLPSSIFSEIRFPGTQIGTVMKSVVEDTGLKQGTPVIIGAADTQCGLLGNGVYKDGQIGVIAGTTTPVQMVISYPFIDPKWRMWTNYYILPNKWVLESNANDTGIIHRWFRDSFYQSTQQTNENHKYNIYELMTQEAEKVESGTNPIFAFLGSEIWNAREKHYKLGGFFLPLPIRRVYERKYFTRSILEGMAYAIRGNIEQIREVMPKRITELFVGGGGSKCNMWLKILANVTNLKILSPKIAESSSIGAAICAARGIGIYPDFKNAVKNMVHLKDPIIPDNKISQRYNESYKQWKNLYSKLLLFNSVK